MLWLRGAAGVGKSAVAQTCAEKLSAQLGAAFFFSRPNKRNDSWRFFPTIAYQLAALSPSYASYLESKIRNNPSFLFKSLEVQYHELIVSPYKDLLARGAAPDFKKIIIVDGLDECDTDNSQREIIRIIIASAEARTPPLSWAIFSRPESHIESTFSSLDSSRVTCRRIKLPVSGSDAREDIEKYLRTEFRNLRNDHRWPTEAQIRQLARKAGGLFVYATTILRFFGDPELPNAEQELQSFLSRHSEPTGSTNPLSELSSFYTLIMERVSETALPILLTILLASELMPHWTHSPRWGRQKVTLLEISNFLGCSATAIRAAFHRLRSVIYLESKPRYSTTNEDWRITYYHASFLRFLNDHQQSGRFCIHQHQYYATIAVRSFQIIREQNSGTVPEQQLCNFTECG